MVTWERGRGGDAVSGEMPLLSRDTNRGLMLHPGTRTTPLIRTSEPELTFLVLNLYHPEPALGNEGCIFGNRRGLSPEQHCPLPSFIHCVFGGITEKSVTLTNSYVSSPVLSFSTLLLRQENRVSS